MDAILKFKEAAKELQNEECYAALAKAREMSDADEGLQNLIGEFNLVRLELNNEMGKGDKDNAKVAELNTKANTLYNNIMGNESMIAYNDAKAGIESFIEYVNAILNTAIEGGDPMQVEQPEHSCGPDGCSSCSGCH